MNDHERQRLAAILGMLGSAHAGERAAAGLQAEAFRKKHGTTWAEVLATEPSPIEPTPPPAPAPAPTRRRTHWGDLNLLVVTVLTSAAIYLSKALLH